MSVEIQEGATLFLHTPTYAGLSIFADEETTRNKLDRLFTT